MAATFGGKPFIMKYLFLPVLLFSNLLLAQTDSLLKEHIFEIDALTEKQFVDFIDMVSPNNQFILIGEQHGIKEVGAFTNVVYDLVYKDGFNTLCIETDGLVAQQIQKMASSQNPLQSAKQVHKEFPLAIPFYNNASDYNLFTNLNSKGGQLWGIDQTFMAQFRLTFDHLSKNTSNLILKQETTLLKDKAKIAFSQSLENKSFKDMFIHKYTDELHERLLATNPNEEEKAILYQLKKTREIYGYYGSQEYYLNNKVRGDLMKSNFNTYYREALKTNPTPKVIFKLGATHATRGLSMTQIYDVSNYLSELAVFNNMRSLHFMVAGIKGKALQGNPFTQTPIKDFDNTSQLPVELQKLVVDYTKKYIVIHLEPLRKKSYGKEFSESLKDSIFNFDVLVLVNNAEALVPFD